MKKSMWIQGFVAVAALALIAMCIFEGTENAEKNAEEKQLITETVERYMHTLGDSGVFDSPDGTTSSMTEAEISAKIEEYNNLVNMTFTADNGCYYGYKTDNEYLFREVFDKRQEDVCFEYGISDCRLTSLKFDDSGNKADVEAVVTSWNRTVEFDGSKYSPHAGAGRSGIGLELVKEGSVWKVSDAMGIRPYDYNGYDKEDMKDLCSLAGICSKALFVDHLILSSEKKAEIEKNVVRSREIMSMKFDTYEEARQAALSIDEINGNYYAMY